MNSKLTTLLKYELKAHSTVNALKHTTGKGKGGLIGALIGKTILYILLAGIIFTISMFISWIDKDAVAVPIMTTVAISAITLIFTLLKTNGYMFAFKEYDMLMALPFSVKTIASAKFLYMYVFNLGTTLVVMIPAIVACFIFSNLTVFGAVIWFMLSLLVPMIPMVVATALGSLITGAGGKFKYKRVVQIVLTIIFIMLCFFSRFFFEWLFKTVGVDAIGMNISSFMIETANYYLPAYWLQQAISGSFGYIFLFIVVSVGLFELYFIIISRFYRQINTRLKVKAFHKEFKMSKQKTRSVVGAVVNNEFLRFKGSNNYLINTGIGIVLIVVLTIASLFFDMDTVVKLFAPGAPVDKTVMLSALPFIIYFFIGMAPTTPISYSLEGKSVWIVRSLPIDGWNLIKGKMIFNYILYTPVGVLATLVLGFKFGGNVIEVILFLILMLVLCGFSTVFGELLGIRFARFDWDNELEVIKRGAANGIYVVSNIFLSLIAATLGIVSFIFGVSTVVFCIGAFVLFGVITLILFMAVKKAARKL